MEAKMKKLLLIVSLFIGLISIVKCQGILSYGDNDNFSAGINDLKVATFYDFRRSELLVGGILNIAEYKRLISIDIGLITQISTSRVVIFGSGINLYELFKRSFAWSYKLEEPLVIGGFIGKSLESKSTYSGIYTGVKISFN